MSQRATQERQLGSFLKDRRAKLDPAALGFPTSRRRIPGLRREEVAQRAHISPTWYTWLEQGRGGAPSADALERIARALMLTDVEREHLFLLGIGRPPEMRAPDDEAISPRLQRVLDTLEPSAAMIKTATWDVVAQNRATALLLTDYIALPAGERNILRQIFGNPHVRAAQAHWEDVARFAVSAFRADVARSADTTRAEVLIAELSQMSPEFAAMWREAGVANYGSGVKHLRHPVFGPMELEYSAFIVDGRPDLSMLVYTPQSQKDADRIRAMIAKSAKS